MRLSELRDYLWADNAQQRNDILAAVRERLGPDAEASVPPALDRVRVMTMHGAKGLSARVVFIPGLEQGLLPNSHQTPYVAQLLEAARLLYVSITRAQAACVMSLAARRTIRGEFRHQHPSQFASQTGGLAREAGTVDAVLGAFEGSPAADRERFRADVDVALDQDPAPSHAKDWSTPLC